MCGCEPTFICSRCAGTQQDWRYFLGEDSGYERQEDENERASTVDWQKHEVSA